MSINSTGSTNYMSNASIMAWMEEKTERLYGHMSTSMDESNNRVDAEDALNDIKAEINNLKANGGDVGPLYDKIDQTIAKYGEEFPEVRQALQPIADELTAKATANTPSPAPASNYLPGDPMSGGTPTPATTPTPAQGGPVASTHSVKVEFAQVKVTSDDAERWTGPIKDKVDTLAKQDQLGMVHLQDLNAQLNRAKDVASALMASADKAADNIVGHIG